MLDNQLQPWLIEINTNPCYVLSCPLLNEIIPEMLENALKYFICQYRITVDSVFPPTANFTEKRAKFSNNVLEENKFQLVYDSRTQQDQLLELFSKEDSTKNSEIESMMTNLEKDDDEVFEDDGNELDD